MKLERQRRVLRVFFYVLGMVLLAFGNATFGLYALFVLVLVLAIVATGVGAALTLDVKLVPNPGDGIVQALADLVQKETGFMKNCFDFGCISVTAILSLSMVGGLVGLGLGTVLAMIGVGRTIAIYHRIVGNRITKLSEVREI